MKNLIERLRKAAKFGGHYAEAANEIEQKDVLITELRQCTFEDHAHISELESELAAEKHECKNLRQALDLAGGSDPIANFLAERNLRFKAEAKLVKVNEKLAALETAATAVGLDIRR